MNNESKYKYNQGDRVYFDMKTDGLRGWAKIVGCATDDMPEIGRGWILELEEESRSVDRSTYPFSCIVVFDVMLSDLPPDPE